jgi:hypothetical protein
MSKGSASHSSFDAVDKLVRENRKSNSNSSSLHCKATISVIGSETNIYESVGIHFSYNVGYQQWEVSIDWEDDNTSPEYTELDLHPGYNTNFQKFKYSNGKLEWNDDSNRIVAKIQS